MYNNPVDVINTNNWIKECNDSQIKLGIKNPILISSDGHLNRQNLKTIFPLKSIFCDVNTDPTFKSCQLAINFIKEKEFDGVIALGGGSVMDTAKTVKAAIASEIYDLSELLSLTETYKRSIPSIFIPTTHGTGSEVTMWGTIWNIDNKKKYSISHDDLYPDVAILDGNLTLSLPIDISIITSLVVMFSTTLTLLPKTS